MADERTATQPAPEGQPEREEGTGTLVREAIEETRDLVRLEVELARRELKEEIARAKVSAAALGAAAATAVAGVTMLLVALALAFHAAGLAALVIGLALVAIAGGLAFAGWKAMPKKPLHGTKERLESDYERLRERIA
jgi:uncharacterized membrane protein YqjE